MNALIIEKTEFTPQVIMDPQTLTFLISGESRPENTQKFYSPVIQWLEKYQDILLEQKVKQGKTDKIKVELKFEYFNSVSAKDIMDILSLLNKLYSQGADVEIKWYYDKRDDDMKEAGEEFSKLIKVPFEVLSN
jgi:hypothetical protein